LSHPDLRRFNQRLGIGAFADPVNHDLVIHPVTAAEMQGHTLTYHGGPTMPNPKAWLVFLNDFWDDWRRADACTRDILEGGYLAPLTAYGSGSGTYLGPVQVRAAIGPILTESQIRELLSGWIMSDEVPQPDDNTLYVLALPDGVKVVFDGQSRGSCEAWCGYHSHGRTPDDRRFIYTVQPATTCGPCGGDFDSWTMILAHEIAEAVTDPTAQGWYDNADGAENADIVAWIRFSYGPWKVQGYWTNETGNTVGEYIAPEARAGQPQPQPQPPLQPRPGPQPQPHGADWRAGAEAARVSVAALFDATPSNQNDRRLALAEAHNSILELIHR
jgi:hypothetical protein